MEPPHYRQTNWLPARAIRERCLWCCADQSAEIALCTAESCPLHPFRLEPKSVGMPALLQAIRQKCIDCCSGAAPNAARCNSRACPLWDFRPSSSPYFA